MTIDSEDKPFDIRKVYAAPTIPGSLKEQEEQKLIYAIMLKFLVIELQAENFWKMAQEKELEDEKEEKAQRAAEKIIQPVQEKCKEKIEKLVPNEKDLQDVMSKYIEELLKNLQKSRHIYLDSRHEQRALFLQEAAKMNYPLDRAQSLLDRLYKRLDNLFGRAPENANSNAAASAPPAMNPDYVEVPVAYPVSDNNPDVVYAGVGRYVDDYYEAARATGDVMREEENLSGAPVPFEMRMSLIFTARRDHIETQQEQERNTQAAETFIRRCETHPDLGHKGIMQSSVYMTPKPKPSNWIKPKESG